MDLSLFQTVRDAFGTVLSWVTSFVRSIVYADGALYSVRTLFFIGTAVIFLFIAFKLIRYVVWGD